jgi:DNA-binding NtrC family response regulator
MTERVLLVDDDRSMGELLSIGLVRRGFEPSFVPAAEEALAKLRDEEFAVVVTDLQMHGMNGLELCERIAKNYPDLPVIVATSFGSMETAVGAIRAGAYDFVTKPIDLSALELSIRRALQHRALREEVRRLRRVVATMEGSAELLGQSPVMRQVFGLVERVAGVDSSVLIVGESGTGKELVCRAIHARSSRSRGPLVAINCAAMPEALLESELFGHARGAFTDAKTSRTGLFVQASGGTLFLDEIGELPLPLQPKLLRALQERKVRPVGGDTEIPFDARIVAATNRDLEEQVAERRFREDLYYRINVIHLALPPLRTRGSDVLLLAQRFLSQHAARMHKQVTGISPGAAERLLAYRWPGNVRELQNCIERAVALTNFAEITIEDLPEKLRKYAEAPLVVGGADPSEIVPLAEMERRYILRALEVLGGSRAVTAQRLGVDRKTLYRKLQQYQQESGQTAGAPGEGRVSRPPRDEDATE